MSSFTLDMTDFQRYADQLEAAAGPNPAIRGALTRYSARVVADAKRLAPVDTGRLRNSIGTTAAGESGMLGSQSVSVVATAPYAGFVEFGTSRNPPQPYMRPAVARHRPAFLNELAEAGAAALTSKTAAGGAMVGAVGRGGSFGLSQQLAQGQFRP